jgi:hypothetical protein
MTSTTSALKTFATNTVRASKASVLLPRRALCCWLVALLGLCGLFGASLSSCGSVQPVRVLPEGQTGLSASLGGPILTTSSPIGFVPYVMLGGMHGVSDAVTLTGNVHALMAAFGVLGVDAGAAVRLVKQNGAVPELTAKAQAYLFTNFKPNSLRVFPYLSLNASYALNDAWLAYGAVENMVQFSGSPRYFVNPALGVQWSVSDRVNLQAEAKWTAANVNTLNGIFEGQSSIGGTGSIGAHIGFVYLLGNSSQTVAPTKGN